MTILGKIAAMKLIVRASWRWSGEPMELDAREFDIAGPEDYNSIVEAIGEVRREIHASHNEMRTTEYALHLTWED